MFEDIANKTPEEAAYLQKTDKFVRIILGTLRILYNFADTHLKYMNQKSILNPAEKKSAKSAQSDPWSFVMACVGADKQHKRDYTVIKNRFAELLVSSPGFEPL